MGILECLANAFCRKKEKDSVRQLQQYLLENSVCVAEKWPEGLTWQEEVGLEESAEKERIRIRQWMAQALGGLRKEGFWDMQGCPDIYVLPYEGEGEVSQEELESTFLEMDQGYHGDEYLRYLEETYA